MILTILAGSIIRLNLSKFIWRSNKFKKYFLKYTDFPGNIINIMLREIDGVTFFKTTYIILTNKKSCKLRDYPHVLLANKEDVTINYNYIYSSFLGAVNQLLIINTDLEHFPKDLSKEFFESRISHEDIGKILDFLNLE